MIDRGVGVRKKFGVAILSYAFPHAHQYTEALLEAADAYIPIIWDDFETRGEAAAAQYQLPYTNSLDKVLKSQDVDAVIVTSETSKHVDLVEKAAGARKAILCAKPLAHSLEECDRIIQVIDETGVPFSMAFQMRHDPVNKKVKELVDSGAIGQISVLRRRHGGPWMLDEKCIYHPFNAWQFDPKRTPGMFMWEGIHVADYMLWMFGEPVSVTAQIDSIVTDTGCDDTGVAIYRFKNGVMGTHFSSGVMKAAENSLEVYGDKGTIVQNYGDTASTEISRDKDTVALKMYSVNFGKKEWKKFDFSPHISQLERKKGPIRPFLDYIAGHGEDIVTVQEGKRSVEMILGAYMSSKEGKTVCFPLKNSNLRRKSV